jgi:molybdate transport system permease protein
VGLSLEQSLSTPAGSPHSPSDAKAGRKEKSDLPFWIGMGVLGGTYLFLIVAMVLAEATFTSWPVMREMLQSETIRFSIKLSLISCSITTILCLWVATPLAYILSRWDESAWNRWVSEHIRIPLLGSVLKRARLLIDSIVDIPIVLPPLVVGLCLLILFSRWPVSILQEHWRITYAVPSVILAQFTVSCAFAVRAMRVTFDGINPRTEQVALTLGCSRAQAFWRVTLPEARSGLLAAATLAWARALGEFGPILVFSGATRMRTEVLSTSVFLYLSTGELKQAVAVSLLMVLAAVVVMILMRVLGSEDALGTRRHLS